MGFNPHSNNFSCTVSCIKKMYNMLNMHITFYNKCYLTCITVPFIWSIITIFISVTNIIIIDTVEWRWAVKACRRWSRRGRGGWCCKEEIQRWYQLLWLTFNPKKAKSFGGLSQAWSNSVPLPRDSDHGLMKKLGAQHAHLINIHQSFVLAYAFLY